MSLQAHTPLALAPEEHASTSSAESAPAARPAASPILWTELRLKLPRPTAAAIALEARYVSEPRAGAREGICT